MRKRISRLLALALCLLLTLPAQAAETEKAATRGQFVQELYESNKAHYGNPGTADPMAWASALGVVRGYGDGSVRADAALTRTQMAVMLYRYAGRMWTLQPVQGDPLAGYDDADKVADWAREAVSWAVSMNLWFSGSATHLGPGEAVTRAECEIAVMAVSSGGAPMRTDWSVPDIPVELTLDSTAANKLEFTLRNNGAGWVFCGADNQLYRKVNGAWYCVDLQNGAAVEAAAMYPGESRSYQQLFLNGALMDLSAGEYRLAKQVSLGQTPHATPLYQTKYLLWEEFTIE